MDDPISERGPAALLVDMDAAEIARVPVPGGDMAVEAFRDVVVATALDYEAGEVAGVLFASRWGGGGVLLT